MKLFTLLLALLLQGCSTYDNAIVDPEICKIREIQRINELHYMTELRKTEIEMENILNSMKVRDIVSKRF